MFQILIVNILQYVSDDVVIIDPNAFQILIVNILLMCYEELNEFDMSFKSL